MEEERIDWIEYGLDGRHNWRAKYLSSEDLFRCKGCSEIKDTTEKNRVTASKWSTRATAKATLCDKCFTQFVNTIAFKFGDWKEWPKKKSD